MVCTHTKISTAAIIFDPHQIFVEPRDLHDPCQKFTHTTDTIQQIRKLV